jgi:hypothetical protein
MLKLKLSVAVVALAAVITPSGVLACSPIPATSHGATYCRDLWPPLLGLNGALWHRMPLLPQIVPTVPVDPPVCDERPIWDERPVWDERPMWDYLRRSSPPAPPILPRGGSGAGGGGIDWNQLGQAFCNLAWSSAGSPADIIGKGSQTGCPS